MTYDPEGGGQFSDQSPGDEGVFSDIFPVCPVEPWRTNWYDRVLRGPDYRRDVCDPAEEWHISEYMALRYWYRDVTLERLKAAEGCMTVAVAQFEEYFASELVEAAAFHAMTGTRSYDEILRRREAGSSLEAMRRRRENELWPVEYRLLEMEVLLNGMKNMVDVMSAGRR